MSAPVLVILHGWGHSSAMWSPVAQLFRDHEVINLDLPGFGSEPLVSGEWGVGEYSRWTNEKLKMKKVKRAILMGHSFGGRIAAHIASTRPDWLAGLILIGAPCLYKPSHKARIIGRIAKVAKTLGLTQSPWSLNSELTEADKKGLGQIYRKVVTHDQTAELAQIATPTLIIRGSLDTYPDAETTEEMHALIAGSALETVAGAGHNIHLESPTLLHAIMNKWFQKTFV
ncbi:MAG: alpha/beta hydrolase [bacterium]